MIKKKITIIIPIIARIIITKTIMPKKRKNKIHIPYPQANMQGREKKGKPSW